MKTVPRNPHQNWMTERINRTILEQARSMRIHAGLPKQFWVIYLINREPSVPLNYGISEEAWTDKKVNLNHLCTFDYISYVHVGPDHKSKLDL